MSQPSDPVSSPGVLASPTFADVVAAAARILPHAHRTPVMTCRAIDRWVGTRVWMKCENLQKTGAFKFRGAINAVAQLSDSERAAGVVTHSSGNHAAALSAAAGLFGCNAQIVMPSNSAVIKQAAVRSYGGTITECQPTLEDREAVAAAVQQRTGATLIPPFNHPHVIAGQGTCAREFLQQVPQLNAMIAPIGGGGLMAGTCLAVRAMRPEMTLWGAEPSGADDAYRSAQAGRLIPQTDPNTICDGLRTGLGSFTWPLIRDQVDEIILADDDQTRAAMRLVWERTKLMIEPSAAVIFAALKNKLQQLPADELPEHVGIIVCGGNVDLDQLGSLLSPVGDTAD